MSLRLLLRYSRLETRAQKLLKEIKNNIGTHLFAIEECFCSKRGYTATYFRPTDLYLSRASATKQLKKRRYKNENGHYIYISSRVTKLRIPESYEKPLQIAIRNEIKLAD